MNYVFTLFISVMVNTYDISVSHSKCSCSDITFEDDCLFLNATCTWNGINCSTWDCTKEYPQDQCATANSCAWKNNSCTSFTKCSDYTSKDGPCNAQGGGCDQSEEENSEEDNYCFDYKTTITIIGMCPTYRNNETCSNLGKGCIWTGSSCRILNCSDFTSNDSCKRVYSENYQTVKLCEWTSNETCTLASSLEVLNEQNCISLTNRRASWNQENNSCVFCSSFSIMITSLISILSL